MTEGGSIFRVDRSIVSFLSLQEVLSSGKGNQRMSLVDGGGNDEDGFTSTPPLPCLDFHFGILLAMLEG